MQMLAKLQYVPGIRPTRSEHETTLALGERRTLTRFVLPVEGKPASATE